MPEHAPPTEPPFNPSGHALSTRIDGVHASNRRAPLYELMGQIQQMDMSEELRVGHSLGLMAAQLTLNYMDRQVHAVYERALDMGNLAMLGYHITSRVPLTPAEMDHSETYQRVILFTRVLDDVQPEPTYARRKHPSIASLSQERIRFNLFGYREGRAEFSKITSHIVADYTAAIRSTPPTGKDIAIYRKDTALSAVVDRFLQVRRSLLGYVPKLSELDETLWRYARNHCARFLSKEQ